MVVLKFEGSSMARDEYEVERFLKGGLNMQLSARDFDEYELERLVETALEGDDHAVFAQT